MAGSPVVGDAKVGRRHKPSSTNCWGGESVTDVNRPDHDSSAVESRISALTPTPSEEMLQRLLAILSTGRCSATYKPALLLALLELAVERAPTNGDALTLPLTDVAERVLALYWPAARPYPGVAGPLRQATAPNSRIGTAISRLHEATGGGHWSLGRLRISASTANTDSARSKSTTSSPGR